MKSRKTGGENTGERDMVRVLWHMQRLRNVRARAVAAPRRAWWKTCHSTQSGWLRGEGRERRTPMSGGMERGKKKSRRESRVE